MRAKSVHTLGPSEQHAWPLNSALEVKNKMKEFTPYIIRFTGLILIAFAITKFPMHYFSYISQLENSLFAYFAPLLLQLTIGIVFFALPQTISDMVIEIKDTAISEIETDKILYICIIITGLFFLFYSLSDIVYHISNYYFLKNQIEDEISILNYDYPGAIATVVELLYSLSLIFKTKSIMLLIRKVN